MGTPRRSSSVPMPPSRSSTFPSAISSSMFPFRPITGSPCTISITTIKFALPLRTMRDAAAHWGAAYCVPAAQSKQHVSQAASRAEGDGVRDDIARTACRPAGLSFDLTIRKWHRDGHCKGGLDEPVTELSEAGIENGRAVSTRTYQFCRTAALAARSGPYTTAPGRPVSLHESPGGVAAT